MTTLKGIGSVRFQASLRDAVLRLGFYPPVKLAGYCQSSLSGRDSGPQDKKPFPQRETSTRSVLALASIISITRSLAGASLSRVVGSGPLTVK
jgi:hypothetical protein